MTVFIIQSKRVRSFRAALKEEQSQNEIAPETVVVASSNSIMTPPPFYDFCPKSVKNLHFPRENQKNHTNIP